MIFKSDLLKLVSVLFFSIFLMSNAHSVIQCPEGTVRSGSGDDATCIDVNITIYGSRIDGGVTIYSSTAFGLYGNNNPHRYLTSDFSGLSSGSGSGDEACGKSGSGGATNTPAAKSFSKGNPIAIVSGNKIQVETDFVGNGEFPLKIERTYLSQVSVAGFFGLNWVTNYGHKLEFGYPDSGSGQSYECPEWARERGLCYPQPEPEPQIIYVSDSQGSTVTFNYHDSSNTWRNANNDNESTLVESDGEYIFTSEHQFMERYNSDGQIIKRTNPTGVSHIFTYDSEGNLKQVLHESGRKLHFTWSSNNLTEIIDNAGNKYQYFYHSNGLLRKVVRPGTPKMTREYFYNDSRFDTALTEIRVNGQLFATYSYDSLGKGKTTEHAGGIEKYIFNHDSASTTVDNPLGQGLGYWKQSVNGTKKVTNENRASTDTCPWASRKITYDDNGYVDTEEDFRKIITDYDYTEDGKLIKKVIAKGTPFQQSYLYEWFVDSDKLKLVQTFDSKTEISYFANGRVKSEVITDLSSNGSYGDVRKTTYSYQTYSNGLLKKKIVDGPRNDISDVIVYDFNSAGDLYKITNSAGHTLIFSDFDALGKPRTITDSNGLVTKYTHDAMGRILTKKIYNNTATQNLSYEYNNIGKIKKVTYPNGNYLQYVYDAGHRLIKVIDRNGYKIKYHYNKNSNVTSQSIVSETYRLEFPKDCRKDGDDPRLLAGQIVSPDFDERCDPIIVSDVEEYFKQLSSYDSLGREILTANATGDNVQYGYDVNSNLTSITNGKGQVKTLYYNAINLVEKIKHRDGGYSYYTYDKQSRLRTITDQRGLVTQYFYNGFGDVVKRISPDTGITNYDYNQQGLVTKVTKNNGDISTFTYDAVGRLTQENNNGQVKNYYYDSGTYRKGRLYYVTDDSGKTIYYYDKVGNVIRKYSKIGSLSFNTYYTYNNMNQLTVMTYPSGHKVHYSYDNQGQVSRVQYQNGSTMHNVVTNLSYRPFGPLEALTYGNGATRLLSHDKNYRVTRILTSGLQNLRYTYDANSDITKITNGRHSNVTQTYGYDNSSRLNSEYSSKHGTYSYQYDKAGNRTKKLRGSTTLQTLFYESSSNQLDYMKNQSNAITQFSYNNNGHTTAKGSELFDYNSENRLVKFVKSSQTTHFTYNAFGQRVKKSGPYGIKHFMYSEPGSLIAEHNASGSILKEYIYLYGQVIGVVKGSTLYYVHNDHLGRAEKITNQSKEVVWQAHNFAFERDVVKNTIGDYNLNFPGQYFDKETDKYYNYFRDYDAETGRYIQSDPIGLEGGLNTFSYVNSNPLSYIDPLGLYGTPQKCIHPQNWAACMAAGMKRTPTFRNFKYHVNKHGGGKARQYFNQALKNIGQGKPFKFKHDGKNKVCFVKRTGENSFTITSTNPTGTQIYTHFNNVTQQYLRNIGITLPKGF